MCSAFVPAVELGLPDFLPASLAAEARAQALSAGEALFHSGQRPTRVFFVAHGEIHLVRHGLQGQAVVLQRSGPGRFLAEPSIDSARYHCDAVAARASRVLSLGLPAFRNALDTDAAFAQRWRLLLAHEIRRLRARSERLALRTVRERIVHFIESEGQDGWLRWPGDMKLLAVELAVTHEALYRGLAALERAGLLERTPGTLRLIVSGNGRA